MDVYIAECILLCSMAIGPDGGIEDPESRIGLHVLGIRM